MNSGIYKITCYGNDKKYFGSSVNLKNRWNRHLRDLRKGVHQNRYLQRAFKKYGEDNFLFEVLEYVEPKNLLTVEDSYLSNYAGGSDCFNINKTSRGTSFGRKTSYEVRQKLSESHKGQVPWNKGLTKDDPRVAASVSGMAKTRWDEIGRKEFGQKRIGKNNPNYKGD